MIEDPCWVNTCIHLNVFSSTGVFSYLHFNWSLLPKCFRSALPRVGNVEIWFPGNSGIHCQCKTAWNGWRVAEPRGTIKCKQCWRSTASPHIICVLCHLRMRGIQPTWPIFPYDDDPACAATLGCIGAVRTFNSVWDMLCVNTWNSCTIRWYLTELLFNSACEFISICIVDYSQDPVPHNTIVVQLFEIRRVYGIRTRRNSATC